MKSPLTFFFSALGLTVAGFGISGQLLGSTEQAQYLPPHISPVFTQADLNRNQIRHSFLRYFTSSGESETELIPYAADREKTSLTSQRGLHFGGAYTLVPEFTFGARLLSEKTRYETGASSSSQREEALLIDNAVNWKGLFYLGMAINFLTVEDSLAAGTKTSTSHNSIELNAIIPFWQNFDLRLAWTPGIQLNDELDFKRAGQTQLGLFRRAESSMLGAYVIFNRSEALNSGLKDTIDFKGGFEAGYQDYTFGGYLTYMPSRYKELAALSAENIAGYRFEIFANYQLSPRFVGAGRIDWLVHPQDTVMLPSATERNASRNLLRFIVEAAYSL